MAGDGALHELGDDSDDPENQAAVDHLDAVVILALLGAGPGFLARAAPSRRLAAGDRPRDGCLYVTADELAELDRRIDDVLAGVPPAPTDPSLRPARLPRRSTSSGSVR